MTLTQIEHLFHGSAEEKKMTGAEEVAYRKNKIHTTFDNVCRRYKLTPRRLLLVSPKDLAAMIKAVDAKLIVDEAGASAAVKQYLAAVR